MYNLQTDKDKYFLLGRIIKTYSYKGGIIIHLDTDDPQAYATLEMFFINMDQSLVPWFISEISIRNDLATVKLDDIDELEQARKLPGKEVYLPVDKLKHLEGNDFYFHEVIGFKAVDENYGDIGTVTEILKRKEQEIIRIMKGDKEVMVPLIDEMISNIDRKSRILYLITPPGLIDLYLE